MDISIIRITDDDRRVVVADWLARAEAVHRQLRPQLEPDYPAHLGRVIAAGLEMSVAVVAGRVAGLAMFRTLELTVAGREMYVADLVTDESQRSRGVGRALLLHLEELGHERGCRSVTLESGVHRARAHRFYFREGFHVSSFHFTKAIESGPA
jgi:ribosomal protein S18 acetylase RimI-like enzyme